MWTPAKLDSGEDAQVFMQRYGFGWELANLRGRPTVGHGGASGTYVLRFVDEPLTVIVLTNLESQDGHPRRALGASARRRGDVQYQPPDTLAAKPDPDAGNHEGRRNVPGRHWPATRLRVNVGKVCGVGPGAIGAQAVMAKQLSGASQLQYLAYDDLDGRSLWGGEPQSRLVHYSAKVNGRVYFLSVGITADRKVASFEFQAGR